MHSFNKLCACIAPMKFHKYMHTYYLFLAFNTCHQVKHGAKFCMSVMYYEIADTNCMNVNNSWFRSFPIDATQVVHSRLNMTISDVSRSHTIMVSIQRIKYVTAHMALIENNCQSCDNSRLGSLPEGWWVSARYMCRKIVDHNLFI